MISFHIMGEHNGQIYIFTKFHIGSYLPDALSWTWCAVSSPFERGLWFCKCQQPVTMVIRMFIQYIDVSAIDVEGLFVNFYCCNMVKWFMKWFGMQTILFENWFDFFFACSTYMLIAQWPVHYWPSSCSFIENRTVEVNAAMQHSWKNKSSWGHKSIRNKGLKVNFNDHFRVMLLNDWIMSIN